ncbi:FAD-binding oxidoreductase [Natranaerofaba carboxydovora]|uniref:FAD-binding oxidoreductase n=1 Tax=Natranaerofaba carboxydovora TaxID=2742683 RepID=UPI001F142828|nr:FAD-binding oxidoreductase [Natranaerofaba carboxydovora]UMZ74108.1 putative FAD-linked oxidoreductase [Natranaerofaba carboxydovora]
MQEEIISRLSEIVEDKWVVTDNEGVSSYAKEHTMDSYKLVAPEPVEGCVVVKPKNAEEISKILKLANETKIPVVPKGGKTALAANAIPDKPSIIVSDERLNKIHEIDEENLSVTCDTAVTLGDLVKEMKKHDTLYFPLHPGDEGAHVGGMVSMNAGGVRAIRYGVMRDQVLGMEVVLPNGEIVNFGGKDGKLLKNNAGYDLRHLLIGSEGTLGFITKVVLKLVPEPKTKAILIMSYEDRGSAFRTVPALIQAGVIPQAVEYVERDQIKMTAKDLGENWPATDDGKCDLIAFMAEEDEDTLYEKCELVEKVCEKHGVLNIWIAESTKEQQSILDTRSHVLPSVEKDIVDMPDVTVPRSKLAGLIDEIDKLADKFNTRIPILAHAGDGNLHVFILKENDEKPDYFDELKGSIYEATIELGGTITGEHGIGYLRKNELKKQLSITEYEIMKKIKEAFDPNGIFNPNKFV